MVFERGQHVIGTDGDCTKMPGVKRVPLNTINDQITCYLCKGYFVDATTVIECLHTFCRSCIVRYLETHKYCPVCDVLVHKTKPLTNIRPDKTMQDIVYKLVPRLYQAEMCRRRDFYVSHPESTPSALEEKNEILYDYILAPEDNICISLNYFESTALARYLKCPAAVTIGHLRRLVAGKYELSDAHHVDIYYDDDCLHSYLTLMEVAYIHSWRRMGPLELTYRIFENRAKRQRLAEETSPTATNNNNWKEVQLRISENGEISVTGIQENLVDGTDNQFVINGDSKEHKIPAKEVKAKGKLKVASKKADGKYSRKNHRNNNVAKSQQQQALNDNNVKLDERMEVDEVATKLKGDKENGTNKKASSLVEQTKNSARNSLHVTENIHNNSTNIPERNENLIERIQNSPIEKIEALAKGKNPPKSGRGAKLKSLQTNEGQRKTSKNQQKAGENRTTTSKRQKNDHLYDGLKTEECENLLKEQKDKNLATTGENLDVRREFFPAQNEHLKTVKNQQKTRNGSTTSDNLESFSGSKENLPKPTKNQQKTKNGSTTTSGNVDDKSESLNCAGETLSGRKENVSKPDKNQQKTKTASTTKEGVETVKTFRNQPKSKNPINENETLDCRVVLFPGHSEIIWKEAWHQQKIKESTGDNPELRTESLESKSKNPRSENRKSLESSKSETQSKNDVAAIGNGSNCEREDATPPLSENQNRESCRSENANCRNDNPKTQSCENPNSASESSACKSEGSSKVGQRKIDESATTAESYNCDNRNCSNGNEDGGSENVNCRSENLNCRNENESSEKSNSKRLESEAPIKPDEHQPKRGKNQKSESSIKVGESLESSTSKIGNSNNGEKNIKNGSSENAVKKVNDGENLSRKKISENVKGENKTTETIKPSENKNHKLKEAVETAEDNKSIITTSIYPISGVKTTMSSSFNASSSNKRKLDEKSEYEPPSKQPTILNHTLGLQNLSNNHPLKKHSMSAPPTNKWANKSSAQGPLCYAPRTTVYNPIINVPKPQTSVQKMEPKAKDVKSTPATILNSKVPIKNKPGAPMGYKTLRDPPKSWNPQLPRPMPNRGAATDGKGVELKNVRPPKFFKIRNNMPRYLGNPASGVKPMYQVQTSPEKEKAAEKPDKTETIKKHSIVKIDPKTLKPISERAPEISNLSRTADHSDLKINASSVSIFNPLKLQSSSPKGGGGAGDRKSPKSPNKILNFTPPNPFIPNLQSPAIAPNQFLFPGPFNSYDPRMMAAYHSFLYGQTRLPFVNHLTGINVELSRKNYELQKLQQASAMPSTSTTSASPAVNKNVAAKKPKEKNEKSLQNAVEKLTQNKLKEKENSQEKSAAGENSQEAAAGKSGETSNDSKSLSSNVADTTAADGNKSTDKSEKAATEKK